MIIRRFRSFSPSATQELLLRAALLPDGDARKAWRQATGSFDVERLEPGLLVLMPLLYLRREVLHIPQPAVAKLRGLYRHSWYRNQVILDRLSASLAVMDAAGITPLIFGGAALATEYYDDPASRPIPHLELLIPRSDHAEARSALESAGWMRITRGDVLNYGRPVTFEDPGGHICFVFSTPIRSHRTDDRAVADLYTRAVETVVGGVAVRRLDATDQLWHSCAAGSGQSAAIQAIADAWFVLTSGADIAWDLLLARTVESRTVLPVRDTLAYLSSLGAQRIPRDVIIDLQQERPVRREIVASRLSSRSNALGDFPQTLADYVRYSAEDPALRSMFGLPKYLAQVWDLDRTSAVGPVVMKKAFAALVRRRSGRTRVSGTP